MARYIWYILTQIYYRHFFKSFGIKSYIAKPLFLYGTNKVKIGNYVRIFPNSRIEVHGSNAYILINDDVSIGHNLHIVSGGKLIIHSGTVISANVLINNLDNDYAEIGVSINKQKKIVKDTIIGKNCFLGYGSVIQTGTVLGEQCIIGANSVVKGDFPDFSVIAGVPARVIKKYNKSTCQWEKI